MTPTDVQFNTASDHWLDVVELERFSRGPALRTESLPSAFCGDFLAGFAVPDSEAFQAWVLDRQEYYHRLAINILDAQIAHWEAMGAYEDAAVAARLQIQLEPWLEEAHRRCMRALALAGRRDEALRQYELCRRALASELGVEPGASTRALYADIRDGAPLAGGRAPTQHKQPGSARLAPKLVAREEELAQLNGHLDAALAGEGRLIFVCGEAGSGKTALLEAFAASAMAEYPDLLLAGARCHASGGTAEPYAPLRGVAEMLFGDFGPRLSAAVPVPEHADRLRTASCVALAALSEHGLGLVDSLVPAASVARRAATLSLPAFSSHASAAGRPAWLMALAAALQQAGSKPHGLASQETLFDQLIDTLAALARQRPLLLTFDDLHWVDDGTATFLFRLGRDLAGSRLLTLAAYRPATVAAGRRDPQSGEPVRHPLEVVINEIRRSAGDITLDLDHADGRSFVEAFVDTEPNRLGATFRDALYAHTGGHALFTVESLRNLQERGELRKDDAGRWVALGRLNWGALPARVEAAIAERIDRLPESSRRLLAVASVQGDEFTAEVVAELTGTEVPDVIAALSGSLARQHHLVQPQTLRRVRGAQHSVYRFAHHLFQVYLYNQLDAVERAQLHGAVAVALTRQAADDRAEQERLSARLAWHYEAAGMALPAAHALYEAGRQAVRLSAFKEALEFFEHGLALLAVEPPSAERTALERLLEIGLLPPRRTLEGWGAATFEGALARATLRSAMDGDERSRLLTLIAESEHLLAKSQLEDGLGAAERMRSTAAALGEDAFVALAHHHSGVACTNMGRVTKSEEHFEHVLAWQTPERCAELRPLIGIDIAANAMALSAINLWKTGAIERALARSRQAVSEAEARRRPVRAGVGPRPRHDSAVFGQGGRGGGVRAR